MRIYISGPITGVHNFQENFLAAEYYLREKFPGCEIINPTMIKLPLSCTHDDYMAVDIKLLDLCDAVFMLKNWRDSTGACIEYGYALASDMIIIREEQDERK